MKLKYTTLILLFYLLSVSCTPRTQTSGEPHVEKNAVYYWKTVLALDQTYLDIIRRHNVGRIYLRMFDVSFDREAHKTDERIYPNASVKIDYTIENILTDSLDRIEIVPVVYITLDALKSMENQENVLAEKIVERVRRMCSYHNLPRVTELQLDCDWTASTQALFFRLCESVKEQIETKNLNWALSSTIRLHQLRSEAPPVDRGVLMVYNTGSFDSPDAVNSIISVADVEPYVRHLSSYLLHLDAAYPIYSWQLIFRDRKFIGLSNGINVEDSAAFTHKSNNTHIAARDVAHGERLILKGDIIRTETSDYNSIMAVKRLIDQRLDKQPHSTIIYHLDSANISKYSDNEICHIFAPENRP